MDVSQGYLGESFGNITSDIYFYHNVDYDDLGRFDQKIMQDLNAFNYKSNMIPPNY